MSVLVSTVISNDGFQYYAPLFCYTVKRAHPDWKILLFVRGMLNRKVKEYLADNTRIIEDVFLDYPDRRSTCNTLRHFIPGKYYDGHEMVYITDIDFLMFPNNHEKYYRHYIKKTRLPYAGVRGPIKSKQKKITKYWTGKYTRIASGLFCFEHPKFYRKTDAVRKKLAEELKTDGEAFIYREYDEVLLQRIITQSGLKIPNRKNCFRDGSSFNMLYRDIHLGDFKFPKRAGSMSKMNRLIDRRNLSDYMRLRKEKKWRELVRFCSVEPMVKKAITKLDVYAKTRLMGRI